VLLNCHFELTTDDVFLSFSVTDVSLQLCLSHTLSTFRQEVTCEKMLISGSERDKCTAILKDMAHSSNDAVYSLNMERLEAVGCARVLDFVRSSWHDIRSQWVEGLREQHLTLGETSLQRLESVSTKMKSVCCEVASLQQFFMEFRTFLMSMRDERMHHAMMMMTRKPTTAMAEDLLPYRDCLTPYSFRMVQQQHTESQSLGTCSEVDEDVDTFLFESATGTDTTRLGCCTCRIYTSRRLPCKHLLYVRRLLGVEFDESIFDSRWKRADYLKHCQLNLTDGSGSDLELLDMKCEGEDSSENSRRRDSEKAEKYRKAHHMTDQLASLCSKSNMAVFSSRMNLLQKLYECWSRGIEVTIVKLENEEGGSTRGHGRTPKRRLKTLTAQPDRKRLKSVGRPKGSSNSQRLERKRHRSASADDDGDATSAALHDGDIEAVDGGEQPVTAHEVDTVLLAMAADSDVASDYDCIEMADGDPSLSQDLVTIDANSITDVTDCIPGDNGSYVVTVPDNSELQTDASYDSTARGIELQPVSAVSNIWMPLLPARKRGRPKKRR